VENLSDLTFHQEDYVLNESGMNTEPVLISSTSPTSIATTPLRRLLDETSDLIDSPPFTHVLTLLLDAGFSMLVDQKVSQQSFKVPATSPTTDLNTPRVQEIVDVKPVKLPIVLATLTRQAHSIGNGVPNEYLQAMEQVRDLEAFAAVVYSSNWESEISPIRDETTAKGRESNSENGTGDPPSVEDSLVEIGEANTFEGAWSKAVDTVDKVTNV